MSDKTKEKVKCTIPIKVNSYEEILMGKCIHGLKNIFQEYHRN